MVEFLLQCTGYAWYALRVWKDSQRAKAELIVHAVPKAIDLVCDGNAHRVLVTAPDHNHFLLVEVRNHLRLARRNQVPQPQLTCLIFTPAPDVAVVGQHDCVCTAACDGSATLVLHTRDDSRFQLDLRDNLVPKLAVPPAPPCEDIAILDDDSRVALACRDGTHVLVQEGVR